MKIINELASVVNKINIQYTFSYGIVEMKNKG